MVSGMAKASDLDEGRREKGWLYLVSRTQRHAIAEFSFLVADHLAANNDEGGERGERTDGSERSSANLRACSLLGVLLTVASEEAPKLLLEEEKEDSLTLSPPSSPPCSSSMSTATAAWRGVARALSS